MFQSHLGEFAALLTAFFWGITALAFEASSKRIGALVVNFLRLITAFIFLGIFSWITRGKFFPDDANAHNWLWLSLSAILGFVIGDLALFQSFVKIGARVSMLIMSLVPPMTAFIARVFMNERMSWFNIMGMTLTLMGIGLVLVTKHETKGKPGANPVFSYKVSYSLAGIGLAFIAAAGQASGLILSKYGMQDYNPFAASQIRVMTGATGFLIIFTVLHKWKWLAKGLKDKKALWQLLLGSFFGPFLGVSFSLIAIQNTSTGIASTIMSTVPILLIIPSVIIYKEKLKWKEVIGAVLAVGGVAVFFI